MLLATLCVAFCAALCTALCAAAVFPSHAFAEDEGEDANSNELPNYVDERQIPDGSFLYETSIEALAKADAFYDGATVAVTGEVVGDRIRGHLGTNSSWITLYSLKKNSNETYTPASVQVYVSDSLADTIDTYGKYNVHGTYVQVNGTFHLACAEHEGLSDIHADSLSVAQRGAQLENEFEPVDFLPGLAAVALGLLLMFVRKRALDRAR